MRRVDGAQDRTPATEDSVRTVTLAAALCDVDRSMHRCPLGSDAGEAPAHRHSRWCRATYLCRRCDLDTGTPVCDSNVAVPGISHKADSCRGRRLSSDPSTRT